MELEQRRERDRDREAVCMSVCVRACAPQGQARVLDVCLGVKDC